jgi:hypothetical protein
VRLHDLYEQYHQEIQFLSIYIREAHPVDGWWLGRRLTRRLMQAYAPRASFEHYDPKTIEERRTVAGECETTLQYGIRTYVDEMDDAVNKAYAAWPTRLYLIGLDGRVVYAGGLGPYDFKPAKLKTAIEDYLISLPEQP